MKLQIAQEENNKLTELNIDKDKFPITSGDLNTNLQTINNIDRKTARVQKI